MVEKVYQISSNKCTVIVSNSFDDFSNYVNKVFNNNAVIITDSIVGIKYGLELKKQISKLFSNVYIYEIASGETSKTLEVCYDIYSFMISVNIQKKDMIFALGGGVVGDLAGFVASTYKRGIRFVQVPTTFLAQIDSSMGGKNAVNLENTKNIIGTFYHPELIYINYEVLKSLTNRQFINGIVEMTVHGLIRNKELFEFLEKNNMESINNLKGYEENVISENCSIKLKVVQADECDTGLRKILNFGHTIGHAIEGAYKFKYQHGECVAVGIVGSYLVGQKLGYTSGDLVDRIICYIKKLNIDIHLNDMEVDNVIELIERDKKNVDGHITFIVPIDIGDVEIIQLKDILCIKETLIQLIHIFN